MKRQYETPLVEVTVFDIEERLMGESGSTDDIIDTSEGIAIPPIDF